MTSPYLEKPRRELGQAIKDCGINRSDFGFRPQNARFNSTQSGPGSMGRSSNQRQSRSLNWVIAAFCLLIVSAAVLIANTSPDQRVAQEEPNPDSVINIAPAAGGPQ
jgi:hypothetical protein